LTDNPERKRYKTIVIDPPWPVEYIVLKMRKNQKVMPYGTMSIPEIKDFQINNYADDVCNLFMWVTHTYLEDALEIIKCWGFKYHCLLTWDKTNGRPLCGFKRKTEFVIYAYKGKITVNQRGKFIPTLFREELREHSRKPDIFYHILARNTPEPRIDIFARHKHVGFDASGNEVKEVMNLEAWV